MSIMRSVLSRSTDEFDRNRDNYQELLADLNIRRIAATEIASLTDERQKEKREQLLARERICALLDPGSPFLEMCQLADGGIVTGVGIVSDRPCMIIATDDRINDGYYSSITCKKHVRAQRFAWQHRLPCITLVQSGLKYTNDTNGVFADDGEFGSILYNQARMSREGIPQIASVHGRTADAGAFMPALCDEVVIVRNQGELSFGVENKDKNFDAERNCRESGTADRIAESDAHAIQLLRDIVANLGAQKQSRWNITLPREPLHDPREIYGIISADSRIPSDNREIVLRLIDGSEMHEFKPDYGDTLITGFARIKGFEVGILCNKSILFSESAMKATQFIDLCCKRDIPLLFMADINGFMVGQAAEQSGIAKHGAKMITAMSCANVPKYTLIIGGSYGAGYLAMCGRAFKPNALLMWPNSRSAIMGADQVANTLAMVKDEQHRRNGMTWTRDEREAFMAPIRKTYDEFSTAYTFAGNTWCDMVIDPVETRNIMALLLDLAGKVPPKPSRFGVFRM